mmetsp:Transcript_25577/g.48380  ORF Transcript_25577/g.48380 Transcript_25577/m.48380 type:complete len:84 (-) Transcript_25577:22-273(-)
MTIGRELAGVALRAANRAAGAEGLNVAVGLLARRSVASEFSESASRSAPAHTTKAKTKAIFCMVTDVDTTTANNKAPRKVRSA